MARKKKEKKSKPSRCTFCRVFQVSDHASRNDATVPKNAATKDWDVTKKTKDAHRSVSPLRVRINRVWVESFGFEAILGLFHF